MSVKTGLLSTALFHGKELLTCSGHQGQEPDRDSNGVINTNPNPIGYQQSLVILLSYSSSLDFFE
jgi:hypothetical protein